MKLIAPLFALLLCSDAQAFTYVVGKPLAKTTTLRSAVDAISRGGDAPPPELKAPAAIYAGAAAAGANKAMNSFGTIFKLAILSGVHIGFGAYLAMTVGGACAGIASSNPGLQKMIFGAFGLPFGLIMTLVTGGELFTGNTMLVTAAVREGKATFSQLRKSLISSFLGNFAGSLLLASLVHVAGTLGPTSAASSIATAKCSMAFKVAFTRGVLCNFLVATAVYMASGVSTLGAKMVAVWFPISAFVALGLDHSVANMFIIPLGMLSGAADVTIKSFLLGNLLPVTLGNIVGGGCFVALAFGNIFGKKKDE